MVKPSFWRQTVYNLVAIPAGFLFAVGPAAIMLIGLILLLALFL
jgi:uncharacterized protein YjeT (DUF2065 family)